MARMHILQKTGGNFEVVVHAPTPKGENSAGLTWAQAIVAAGLNRTSLPAALITDEEVAQIAAGTAVEFSIVWSENVGPTKAEADAALLAEKRITAEEFAAIVADEAEDQSLSAYADKRIAAHIADLQDRLERFGETVA